MTKITIFSGFLGAGKTTLIKKLIQEGYKGEKLVLIENEFGQIGIDGGFLQDAGVEITEMNSGCICCSLVGDFGKALEKVLADYAPDRILIEPSGVGKLSDVIRAVQNINAHDVELDGFTTVVDAKKYKMYMKNFGEFFDNQITYASCLILSHTSGLSQEKLDECVKSLREKNPAAPIVTTEWDQLTGAQLVDAMTQKNTLDDELKELLEEAAKHDHHHHDMTMRTSMSIIITTMTMMMTSMSTIITTMTMTRMSMNTIIMITVPTAPAAVTTMTTITSIIITTMLMMYSQAGAERLQEHTLLRRSPLHSMLSATRKSTA